MTAETTTPLRRNRRFQLLWAGAATSMLGSELTRVAIPLLLLAISGSPGQVGAVTAVRIASMIVLQIPAGVWVDRSDRRRALVITQALQFVNASALMIMLVISHAGV